jgi:hypothetical protein
VNNDVLHGALVVRCGVRHGATLVKCGVRHGGTLVTCGVRHGAESRPQNHNSYNFISNEWPTRAEFGGPVVF